MSRLSDLPPQPARSAGPSRRRAVLATAVVVLLSTSGGSQDGLRPAADDRVGEAQVDALLDHLRGLTLRLRALRPGGDPPGWVASGSPAIPSARTDLGGRFADRLGQEIMLLEEAVANLDGAHAGLFPEGAPVLQTSVEGLTQEFTLPLPEQVDVHSLGLELENLGSAPVDAPWLVSIPGPDWFDLPSIAAQVAPDAAGQSERAFALWTFLVSQRVHGDPPTDRSDLHDPVRFLNVFGYGFCDDSATVMASLAGELGLDARVWWLNGHVVPELRIEGRWGLLDPDHEAWYPLGPEGRPASVEELERQPGLILAPRRLPGRPVPTYDPERVATYFASAHDNQALPPERPTPPWEMALELLPGDRLALGTGHLAWRFANNRYVPPSRFGNGTLTGRRRVVADGQPASLRLTLPYAVLAGRATAAASSAGRPPTWSATLTAGSSVVPLPWIARGGDQWALPLGDGIPLGMREPVYALRLDFTPLGDAAGKLELELELVFQVAPASLPVLRPGPNTFRWRSLSPDAQVVVRQFLAPES